MLDAIQIDPENGYSKYMYLGQLSVEKDAIQAFEKGVNIMVNDRRQLQDGTDEARDLSSKIANALCSMTEIYLTDCW